MQIHTEIKETCLLCHQLQENLIKVFTFCFDNTKVIKEYLFVDLSVCVDNLNLIELFHFIHQVVFAIQKYMYWDHLDESKSNKTNWQ